MFYKKFSFQNTYQIAADVPTALENAITNYNFNYNYRQVAGFLGKQVTDDKMEIL